MNKTQSGSDITMSRTIKTSKIASEMKEQEDSQNMETEFRTTT